jgi:spermidine synthase
MSEEKDNTNNVISNTGPSNITLSIFLISVLALFLEMTLIRWIGTEVRIFAYLQNTILVTCFLGLGIGCFTSRKPIVMRDVLLPLFILVLLFAIPITRRLLGKTSELLSVLGDLVIWHDVISKSPMESVLFVCLGLSIAYFLLVWVLDIFVPIGRILGRLIDDHPRTILAYSVNVGGSLIGTWLFVLFSALYQPPVIWFALIGGLLLFFLPQPGRTRILTIVFLLVIVGLSWFAGSVPGSMEVVWSPYQKLVLKEPGPEDGDIGKIGKYLVNVNNTGYQIMIDLSDANTCTDPNRYSPELIGFSQYDIPLLLHPNPKTMLVVGAGAGNDVAAALRHNVSHITAVEIDPSILSLGMRYHPERPYASPNVAIVNDDARSFFATCKDHYDVISFGLLDSHTTTTMTNARLDHYVYTKESIKKAKSLLADGGVLTLNFAAKRYFIADRMARVLRDVFNTETLYFCMPVSSYGWGGLMFVVGNQATLKQQISQNRKLAYLIEKWQKENPWKLAYTTLVATDDWPYIYLETSRIPILYYLLAGIMFLLFFRSLKRWNASGIFTRWNLSSWHFFFLGAAFLLLEVQNISKSSVVLGNTWLVNAVIISGVLCMILLANIIAAKFPKLPLMPVYLFLYVTCLLLYFVDIARFGFLPYATKAVIVGGLTALPMIFSGIVFIRSFASAAKKDEALGANLIGALVGALLQSITFVTGIKALLLIVMGFYFLAMLTGPKRKLNMRLAVNVRSFRSIIL